MDDDFIVKTGDFEGPLELLVSLIEKRKLLVSDVSLAQVTDDYVAHVERLEEYNLDDVSDFIVIASTLILIKSKSLLPNLELTPEEELSAKELEDRIRAYQDIRELTTHIVDMFGVIILYSREERSSVIPIFAPSDNLTVNSVSETMRDLLGRLPQHEELPTAIVEKVKSLEESMKELRERIQKNMKVSFNEYSGKGSQDKIDIILTFLALLELMKRGLIHARQDTHFSDIELETRDIATPRYN